MSYLSSLNEELYYIYFCIEIIYKFDYQYIAINLIRCTSFYISNKSQIVKISQIFSVLTYGIFQNILLCMDKKEYDT